MATGDGDLKAITKLCTDFYNLPLRGEIFTQLLKTKKTDDANMIDYYYKKSRDYEVHSKDKSHVENQL